MVLLKLSFLLLAFGPATVISLNCTVCEFALLPPYSQNCEETCEGDVCYIVVNKFFNGTINAGCMHLHDGDKFEDKAICQRGKYDNRCACSTGDRCNNPKVKINSYVFTESPVLEGYQWLPQIQPPMPSLQPLLPEEIPIPSNETETGTSSELENGVENDLLNNLDEGNQANQTVLRNEENDDGEENLLTVTTTVGLNVRDQTNRMQQSMETSTGRGFTSGQGSVEVTKVSQEATKMNQPPRNLTSDGVTATEDPNSSSSFQFLFALMLPVAVLRLLN